MTERGSGFGLTEGETVEIQRRSESACAGDTCAGRYTVRLLGKELRPCVHGRVTRMPFNRYRRYREGRAETESRRDRSAFVSPRLVWLTGWRDGSASQR